MRRILSTLVGIALLATAAVVLWPAWGPQATEARTLGGVLFAQNEVTAAAQGGALDTVTDAGPGLAPVPLQPQFSPAAAADLSTVDADEAQTAPLTTSGLETVPDAAVPLTTNIVLDEAIGVAVAPLAASASEAAPDGQGGFAPTVAEYEQRVVELEWPATFQVGRGGAVRVKLKMLASGALQPIAEVADNEVIATPILITDRYDMQQAFVTATLSAPDFTINAISNPTQQLQRGGEVEWRWTLEANDAGKHIITLGLNITWQPSGPQNVTIWGQTVQVEANYVFGLITVPQASIVGSVLGVMGMIAQFPLLEKFLEIFLDILFGGARRRRREEERRRRQRRRR